jgi:hypothetical protein
MRPHNDVVLSPEELSVLRVAFDAAWDVVAPEYDASSTGIEVGRLRLANAVLAACRRGLREPAIIKAEALRRMAKWRHESRVAL